MGAAPHLPDRSELDAVVDLVAREAKAYFQGLDERRVRPAGIDITAFVATVREVAAKL